MTPTINARHVAAVAAVSLVLAACGASDDDAATDIPSPPTTVETTAPPAAVETTAPPVVEDGIVSVRLEEVQGFFIEGFEVGLRIEDATGETVASTLWGDMVAARGDDSLEAFYESVWEVDVPAGPITVHGTANIGAGPPPETPDITGELNCTVDVDVASGETVTIEVSFDPEDCLTVVDA